MRKEGLTLVEGFIVVAIIAIVFFVAEVLLHPPHARESVRRKACEQNLKQFASIFDLYAEEHAQEYPPVDDTKNNFIFEGDAVYPGYLTDSAALRCVSDPEYDPDTSFRLISNKNHPDSHAGDVHPDCLTDLSYCYFGWILTSDEEAEAFLEAYDNLSPEDYGKDIVVPEGKGNGGGNIIHRLGPGAEQFFDGTSIDSSTIPIMWDKPSADIVNWSHVPAGGNVLYLDGHTESIRYPGKFPMTEKFGRMLDKHPREPIPDCED